MRHIAQGREAAGTRAVVFQQEPLVRRVDEAAKYVPLERLAVSPQCGFGSDVVGNLISEDDQKRKLERVAEAARKIWN